MHSMGNPYTPQPLRRIDIDWQVMIEYECDRMWEWEVSFFNVTLTYHIGGDESKIIGGQT